MEILSTDNKVEILRNLRKFAIENGIRRRLDEDFLKRFLHGHQNNVLSALKALCNYESFINRRSEKWLKVSKSRLQMLLESHVIDVLENVGLNGQKIVWIRLENWDTALFSADEILEVSGLLCELAYAKHELIHSVDIIIDLHNFSLKHLYALSPKFAKRMIFFMSECLPMQLYNIFVIRQPKIFYLLYAVFKPFIEDRMQKLIFICGHNFKQLYEQIGEDILPNELGGNSDLTSPQRWINVLYKPRNLIELKKFGYEFYDDRPIEFK